MGTEDQANNSTEDIEITEWLESLDYVLKNGGPERAKQLLKEVQLHAYNAGVRFTFTANTPYVNTIHHADEAPYPGDIEIEKRIRSMIRWNAMAMVVRAQRGDTNVGGHISTYASSATLYEVGFNHFFRAKTENFPGDLIYFQGHSAPGIYARAFLEGRLSEQHLQNFRRELSKDGGLSSYPHPRLSPNFWQFPTVSMGLGPLMSIYHARFIKYLENRGLKERTGEKIWTFIGDGETDEPETLGAINMASREKLDNLIFVINCNLQRLDGPVRGNGKIIQELEGIFRGAGWNVIKVVWGKGWDSLLDEDSHGDLLRQMTETVDGTYQKYSTSDGAYIREHFFSATERLSELTRHLTDEEIKGLRRGGHDTVKVYNAYKRAVEHTGAPTVILAKTIKGYGLGESGEGKNVTHNQKKLNEKELRTFRSRFGIPISDEDISKIPFYTPPKDSREYLYLQKRRESLGGFLPKREVRCPALKMPPAALFEEFFAGSGDNAASTTMAFHRILAKLLKDKEIGKYIVPIIPDEARTFGMEGLFRQVGIFSQVGQLYEPVDKDSLMYYKESLDGQILEEGINEAGAMSSFIAAATAYANFNIPMIPFYIYYSMFGYQRVGDLVWAAGDMMSRGFLLGGTAGRTSLNGEGLQHQDGHSHVLFGTVPNVVCYDPAFAFEVAVLIQEGIQRMYEKQENVVFYITVGTDTYQMPAMPANPEKIKEGIIKGIYRLKQSKTTKKNRAHLLGSGAIINSALEAQELLANYDVQADVWSVTSYNELRRDGLECDRWNMLHPAEKPRIPYVTETLANETGVFVASSDYMKLQPDSIAKWLPGTLISLGTDGFGLSETRGNLRDHFEVDAKFMVLATLTALVKEGKADKAVIQKAIQELGINTEKKYPLDLTEPA